MLSMTGYGRSRVSRDGREMLLELKTVNHRFLDVSFRMPKALSFLEEPLRARTAEGALKRGHVELSLNYQNNRPDVNSLRIDQPLVMQSAKETAALAQTLHLPVPSIYELINMSNAATVTQADEDTQAVTELAVEAYDSAFSQLQAMRTREGEALASDLRQNLHNAQELVGRIAQRAPDVPRACRARLEARLAEWNVQPVDPQRIAQEIAFFADKCAIDEELSRLDSHFQQFAACLEAGGEVGRRMDFLLQEMNRETNTIGSKAADAQIAGFVVEIKCLLEKLREQVQNVV